MDCPFCDKTIEQAVFARSENFLAIYNLAPILPGHSLVIPRKHYGSLMELNDHQLEEMILFSRKVTRLLLKVFCAESFNWTVQDKDAAGQTIAHLHLHIVLRYPGDMPNPGDWYPAIQNNNNTILDSALRDRLTSSEMKIIIARLSSVAEEGC